MSMPASFRGGPTTTNTLTSKKYLIFHFLLIWLSAIPIVILMWTHIPTYAKNPVYFIITLPIYLLLYYLAWTMLAILLAKVFLEIINKIHPPKEGYFPRDRKNIDYRYWSIRATIKKFPIWMAHNFPLPWIDHIVFKMFGVKVKTSTTLFDAWVDVEFVEIGENTTIGQGAIILSTMITRDWLVIKKVKIGENVVIGGYSVISPGTVIGDNCILGALSGTTVGQECEANWVYWGIPCRKFRKNEYQSLEASEEELERKSGQMKLKLTIDEIEELERRTIRKRLAEKIALMAERKAEKKETKAEKKAERKELKAERKADKTPLLDLKLFKKKGVEQQESNSDEETSAEDEEKVKKTDSIKEEHPKQPETKLDKELDEQELDEQTEDSN